MTTASGAYTAGGPTGLPLALIAQAIPKLTRNDLEALTERLIDYLDEQDGNADVELNGDERDGSLGEDDFCPQNNRYGAAGCPVSDPDMAVDDGPCDDDFDREVEQCEEGPFCDPIAYRDNLARIQITRCTPIRAHDHWRGKTRIIGHHLKDDKARRPRFRG